MSIQQTILTGIRELLFFHDYLVLPRFGGFVLKPHPAHFSAGAGQLMPPGKTITFNAQLKQNDGILIQWLQTKMAVDAAQAATHLADFTDYCQSVLAAKRRLAMDGLGFFYLDFENNLCFEPGHDLNFLASSFGLGPVAVNALIQEEPEPVRKPMYHDRVITAEPAPVKKRAIAYRRLSNMVLLATLLCGLLFLLVANTVISGQLTASMFGEQTKSNYRSINYEPLQIETSAPTPSPYVADANGVALISLDEKKKLAVQALAVGEDGNVVNPSERYELVLGCFAVEKNARKLVKKLGAKKLRAHISGVNAKGMYVVSTGSFHSKPEAIKELSRIKGLYPNTWIRLKD